MKYDSADASLILKPTEIYTLIISKKTSIHTCRMVWNEKQERNTETVRVLEKNFIRRPHTYLPA
jgi:hypothetical protein